MLETDELIADDSSTPMCGAEMLGDAVNIAYPGTASGRSAMSFQPLSYMCRSIWLGWHGKTL